MADPTTDASDIPEITGTAPRERPRTAEEYLVEDIERYRAELDPKIEQSIEQQKQLLGQGQAASERALKVAEETESGYTAQEQQVQQWFDSQPSRQAVYATAMHAAPVMAILTAIGGKFTRLQGQQMLAATTGIVQGMNSASEKNYNAAINAWQTSYQAYRDHMTQWFQMHKMMMEAYAGRADASQKAAEAAGRMTGDLLTQEQQRIAQRIDYYKAMTHASYQMGLITAAIERAKAYDVIAEAARDRAANLAAKAATSNNPQVKLQMQELQAEYRNWSHQTDEAIRLRRDILAQQGYVDEETINNELHRYDMAIEELRGKQNEVLDRMDQLVSGAAGTAPRQPIGQGAPPMPPGTPPRPQAAGATPPHGAMAAPVQRHAQAGGLSGVAHAQSDQKEVSRILGPATFQMLQTKNPDVYTLQSGKVVRTYPDGSIDILSMGKPAAAPSPPPAPTAPAPTTVQ